MANTQKIKQQVTNEIIALMQTHGSDWVKPFSTLCGIPTNATTGKQYRGMNAFWLGLQGETYWATYKQWRKIGAQVISGPGSASYITVPMVIKDRETGEKTGMFFGSKAVFSAAQVDGWQAPTVDAPDTTEVLANVDRYIANTGADIRYNPTGGAFYQPGNDYINMPTREQFTATSTSTATECFYSTTLHELTHWTGHKSRCDRLALKNKNGRAFEELVAEIGATMQCVQLGISAETRADHAQYIANWLGALEDNREYIFTAASKAQDAVDFIRNLQPEVVDLAA